MQVGVLGINHKLANLKLRELLAKACNRRIDRQSTVHCHHSFVLLSTCNRTEVYFSSDDLAKTHSYLLHILRAEVNEEFDHKLYSYFGADCFSHLCRVTSGLDSAIIAETEIQGQVKASYERATNHGKLPSELHFIFQKSLQIGKRIRSQLDLGRGMPDLEHAVFQVGEHFFQEPRAAHVLFVGASAINRKIIHHLRAKRVEKIAICNRSQEHIKVLAAKDSLEIVTWKSLSSWHNYDWIIFGTKSPDHLLTPADLPEKLERKLIMDLCVPRNVDPRIRKKQNITLLNIDQMNRSLQIRKQRMNHLLAEADSLITGSTYRQMEKFASKFRLAGVTREGNRIANIVHTSHELDQALEA